MIEIKGYKNLNYKDFQTKLHQSFSECGKSTMQVAADIKVKSPTTAQNAFGTEKQLVSDEVMTNVMEAVGLSGFILWAFGTRQYYVKTK